MPKYTNPQLTSWTTKGYMDFLKYDGFKEMYNSFVDDKNKFLLTFFYFTGARPSEALELKRDDILINGEKISFRVTTMKRNKKKQVPDKRVRLIEWNMSKFPELKDFWLWIKDMPNEFFVFSYLKLYGNPRSYMKYHLKLPIYFFRHNLFSLVSMSGGSRTIIRELKGAKDERSVEPYIHLSKEERIKSSRILAKAVQ